jgi:hypothetical protein
VFAASVLMLQLLHSNLQPGRLSDDNAAAAAVLL